MVEGGVIIGWKSIPPYAYVARSWDFGLGKAWSRAVVGTRNDPSTKPSNSLVLHFWKKAAGIGSCYHRGMMMVLGREGLRSEDPKRTCLAISLCRTRASSW